MDTTRAAHDVQIRILRGMTPSERVQIAAELSEQLREVSIQAERARHPEWTREQARAAVFRRIWGEELAARALGLRGGGP